MRNQDREFEQALENQKIKEQEEILKKEQEKKEQENQEQSKLNKIQQLKDQIQNLPEPPKDGIKLAVNLNGKRHFRAFSKSSKGMIVYVWISSLHFDQPDDSKLFPHDFTLTVPLAGPVDPNLTLEEQILPPQFYFNLPKMNKTSLRYNYFNYQ